MAFSLNAMTGEEVFLIGYDGQQDTGELAAYEGIDDALEYLKSCNPETEQNLMVLHGILTHARALPSSLDDVRDKIWIVVVNPNDIEAGGIWKSESGTDLDALASEVEFLVLNKSPIDEPMDIEDVYILYGYQLELGLAVNEEDVDESYIRDCEDVAKEAHELHEETEWDSAGGTGYG